MADTIRVLDNASKDMLESLEGSDLLELKGDVSFGIDDNLIHSKECLDSSGVLIQAAYISFEKYLTHSKHSCSTFDLRDLRPQSWGLAPASRYVDGKMVHKRLNELASSLHYLNEAERTGVVSAKKFKWMKDELEVSTVLNIKNHEQLVERTQKLEEKIDAHKALMFLAVYSRKRPSLNKIDGIVWKRWLAHLEDPFNPTETRYLQVAEKFDAYAESLLKEMEADDKVIVAETGINKGKVPFQALVNHPPTFIDDKIALTILPRRMAQKMATPPSGTHLKGNLLSLKVPDYVPEWDYPEYVRTVCTLWQDRFSDFMPNGHLQRALEQACLSANALFKK